MNPNIHKVTDIHYESKYPLGKQISIRYPNNHQVSNYPLGNKKSTRNQNMH